VAAKKLVVASGGLSMPGLGASPFGYKLAEQFGLNVLPTRAGLVPFTLQNPCWNNFRCSPASRYRL
jgi:predicted flavoprotein YhiN